MQHCATLIRLVRKCRQSHYLSGLPCSREGPCKRRRPWRIVKARTARHAVHHKRNNMRAQNCGHNSDTIFQAEILDHCTYLWPADIQSDIRPSSTGGLPWGSCASREFHGVGHPGVERTLREQDYYGEILLLSTTECIRGIIALLRALYIRKHDPVTNNNTVP
jgi:hypothetical protein